MGYVVVVAQGGSLESWSCVLFPGHLELAPQYFSMGFDQSTLELMGAVGRGGLSQKAVPWAVCSQVFNGIHPED